MFEILTADISAFSILIRKVLDIFVFIDKSCEFASLMIILYQMNTMVDPFSPLTSSSPKLSLVRR